MPVERNWLSIPITVVLVVFFSVPIGFLLYGGAGSAIGGLILISGLILFQWPLFQLMKKAGYIPNPTRSSEPEIEPDP